MKQELLGFSFQQAPKYEPSSSLIIELVKTLILSLYIFILNANDNTCLHRILKTISYAVNKNDKAKY
jgi:hypothetical protein